MATFGENLRREREMRGVTLEEISASTKIGVRFLKSLENEDFGKLPGGIFTRSFLRAYAKYLGLDEDHVMAEYHLLLPAGSDNDITRIAHSRPMPKRGGTRASVLAVLVSAVLLASGYLLYLYTRESREAKAPASVASPPVSTPVPAPGVPVIPQVEEGLILQVAATERAWVAVDADGKMVLQRVLDPGEFETLRAKDSFQVTTGNAQGIVLTLNGETLKPLGRRAEVKAIRLTRNDVKKNSL